MRRLVVMVQPDQVNGYRLAGLEAFGVDDHEPLNRLVRMWLRNDEEILLALGDSLFPMLEKSLVDRIYASEKMLLVTIPDGPVSVGDKLRQRRIFEAIRHATGAQIRFKGEEYGSRN